MNTISRKQCQEVISDLLLGVDDEWRAVSSPKQQWLEAEIINLQKQKDSSVLLRLRDFDDTLFEGSAAAIRLDLHEYHAEVVDLDLTSVLLKVEDCELEMAHRCLIKVGARTFLLSLLETLHGLSKTSTPALSLATALTLTPDERGDLGSSINYTIGAPGSGKTTALINRVTNLTRQGRRVAVVTYTNAAADVIFEKLGASRDRAGDVTVCRFGITERAQEIEKKVAAKGFMNSSTDNDIENADVLVTTAYRAAVCVQNQTQPRTDVLIDEASTMPLSLAFVSSLLATESVSVYGDPFQLGPIALAEHPDERTFRQRFETNPFDIPGVIEAIEEEPQLSILRTQFRLPSALARASTAPTYVRVRDESIKHEGEEEPESPWGSGSLLYFDSSPLGAVCERVAGSRRNEKHAEIVIEALRVLLEQGSILPETAQSSILVITPYRAQRALLQSKLRDTNWIDGDQIDNVVTTIHRAQGQERDFVLLDIPDAPSEDPTDQAMIGRPWQGQGWQSPGSRLLQTALSRARKQALVLMYRQVTGIANDPDNLNFRALSRLNAKLNRWGSVANIDVSA